MSANRSCKKKKKVRSRTCSSPLIEDFAEIFKIINFLLLVPIALNNGWSRRGDLELSLRRITSFAVQKNLHTWASI